jgi:cysteinyl-tRNA synthetase
MSKKYLGETFDIHGGGMDLLFPHHESEVAQSMACSGHQPANYWMHHNMITVNGQKMAKSLNNGISIDEFFSGKNPLLEKAYSPMTLKFFILQAHYRGTLDFSNAALQGSEKGLSRLLEGVQTAARLKPSDRSSFEVKPLVEACYEALNEDLNTPILIAALFELLNQINLLAADKATVTEADLNSLKSAYSLFLSDILGLVANPSQSSEKTTDLIQMLIQLRQEAKAQKNYALSDQIRIQLSEIGIELKDSKEGTHFTIH